MPVPRVIELLITEPAPECAFCVGNAACLVPIGIGGAPEYVLVCAACEDALHHNRGELRAVAAVFARTMRQARELANRTLVDIDAENGDGGRVAAE